MEVEDNAASSPPLYGLSDFNKAIDETERGAGECDATIARRVDSQGGSPRPHTVHCDHHRDRQKQRWYRHYPQPLIIPLKQAL